MRYGIGYELIRYYRRQNRRRRQERMKLFVTMGILACGLLAGCSSLPGSGPSASDVVAVGQQPAPQYDVILVDPPTITALSQFKVPGFVGTFAGNNRSYSELVGRGDVISIAIFESGAGGLFSIPAGQLGGGSKSAAIPGQTVDKDGFISVPYAGRVRAAGRTPFQIQRTIEDRLKGKAIEPQAIVSLVERRSAIITISGEVGQGGRFPMMSTGMRVLDAIALAGGPRIPANEVYVRLARGGRTAAVLLQQIVNNPRENVGIVPGDDLFLYRYQKSFVALGAVGRAATIPFDTVTVSLAEALGKLGGLMDHRADAAGVFVFRFEEGHIYRAIRPGNTAHPDKGKVPVVYQLDLKQPASLHLSQSFQIRDKDVVYIANAPGAELQKFLSLVGSGLGIAATGASVGIAASH